MLFSKRQELSGCVAQSGPSPLSQGDWPSPGTDRSQGWTGLKDGPVPGVKNHDYTMAMAVRQESDTRAELAVTSRAS